MRKLFTEPVMDINVFDVENIVTGSNGTPVDPASIDGSQYATATASWTAGETLEFTF